MGKKPLEDQAKILADLAGKVYLKHDKAITANLKGTKQAADYEAAKRRYNIDGCADAISDMSTTLKGIARKLPRHSSPPPPKSNPTSRRLKRSARR